MSAIIIPFPKRNQDQAVSSNAKEAYLSRIMDLEKKVAELMDNPPLRKNERCAIRSLIGFAAQDSGMKNKDVLQMVLDRFNAFDINDIRSKDYNDVVSFLVRLEAVEAKV